jgi:hypothetical protein
MVSEVINKLYTPLPSSKILRVIKIPEINVAITAITLKNKLMDKPLKKD